MTIITTNAALKDLCTRLSTCPFVTVDTEFVREKTYYAILCLIQIAGPDQEAFAIDVIAKDEDLDLTPLWELMANQNILKVFHAARQDLEIIYQLSGSLPSPLYDTQIAAMVCGYGDQIGYEALVTDICKEKVDKSSQFTDWAHRPLSPKQISYALGDVIHLVDVYHHLNKKIAEKNRSHWVSEEMLGLLDKKLYDAPPRESWRRLKLRAPKARDIAVLRELAAWREEEAQRKDVPRGRILKDETILDLTYQKPENEADLARIRGISTDMAKGKTGKNILEVIKIGMKIPEADCPKADVKVPLAPRLVPAVEMLKMLLRLQSA
ncbi:MAG: ribonuclease D, partial [Pseudomonadota bacterium]